MAEEPEKAFLADMTGIYAQHASMWSIYTESIKILVSVTSLPILVASVLISLKGNADASHAINLTDLPPLLAVALALVPFIDLPLLGVVIHHRLVILTYARWLNGCRSIYLEWWDGERAKAQRPPVQLPMPSNPRLPSFFEPWGPMGLIVHGSALINAIYMFGAVYTWSQTPCTSAAVAVGIFVSYEFWYWSNCKREGRHWVIGQPGAPTPQQQTPSP